MYGLYGSYTKIFLEGTFMCGPSFLVCPCPPAQPRGKIDGDHVKSGFDPCLLGLICAMMVSLPLLIH